jgi:energy-coupling factor transporter transmembrane protein EcfT
MKFKRKILKGSFTGFYKASSLNYKLSQNNFTINWELLNLSSIELIEDYEVSDLKKGLYSYIPKTNDFKIEDDVHNINDNELNDIFLKDFNIVKSFNDGSDFFVKVEGVFFAKTPKIKIPDLKPEISTFKTDPIKPINQLKNNTKKEPKIYSSSSSTNNVGCLTYISSLLSIWFLLFTISTFNDSFLIFCSLILCAYVFLFGRIKILRNSFFLILGIFLVTVILGIMSQHYNNTKSLSNDNESSKLEDEIIEIENDEESSEKVKKLDFYSHYHNWKNYSNQKYSGDFKTNKDFFSSTKYNRENPKIFTSFELSQDLLFYFIYKNVLEFNRGKLEEIIEMFQSIKNKNNFNRTEFAELIVSSVQAIPYVLISQKPCLENEFYDPEQECMGNVLGGFQSPVEFMSNFKGDCDTRALLCFSILERFGYDVAVLLSDVYQHSVLGINLNIGGGDYIKHKGKRYYAWETTSIGWKPGNLPPDFSRMYYWKISLTNKDLKK